MKPPNDPGVPGRYPPMSVWLACDVAGRRAEELRAEGRELHFGIDDETGKLVIELCDLDGRVLEELPVRAAIAIADGDPL